MLEAVLWENPTYEIFWGGGCWKRGLWRNCNPILQPKGQGRKPSVYGCARQCPIRQRAKEASRLERQLTMSLPQMLADLPRACDVGTKSNAKGHTTSWIGYKLHVDTADGGVPISCIMTSASTHDSQVAIPLGTPDGRAGRKPL